MNSGSIKLEKINNNGKTQIHQFDIVGNTFTCTWGVDGGKLQAQSSTVLKGKNIGRANETTPEKQALQEVITKIKKKVDEKYSVVSASGLLEEFSGLKASNIPSPMLAKEYSEGIKLSKIFFTQPKFDGIRCLANTNTGELYSRKGKIIVGVPHISEQVLEAKKQIPSLPEWLDGELYCHGKTFQQIMSLVRPTVNIKDSSTVNYHIYDCISDDKFSARNQILLAIEGAEQPNLCIVETTKCENVSELKGLHDSCVKDGYEGLIIRNDTPYVQKRTKDLLKLKEFIQEEYVIIDFEKEEYEDTLGSINLITKEGAIFAARPAMTDEERKELWLNKEQYMSGAKKMYLATVKFQEFTDDGVPRFPVCLGIRHEDDL